MEAQGELVAGANFGVNLFEIGTEKDERVIHESLESKESSLPWQNESRRRGSLAGKKKHLAQ
jgi:hypothetical protein